MDIVVGGGKYGVEAARYLEGEGRDFVVLDPDPNCLAVKELKLDEFGSGSGREILNAGIEVLPELLERLNPEYVFPTAPIHVAAEAARLKYSLKPWNEVVDCILSGLPARVVLASGRGSVVVSYNRDGDCLPKCSAPEICPVTGMKKPCPMHELVRFAYPQAFILVSRQLKPGLGALKGEELLEFMRYAERLESFVVATACRCHGVITALRK